MSTLAITTAHFAAIPARFAIGKWSNLSTPTLLAFNTVDIGLLLLIRSIGGYVVKNETLKITDTQNSMLLIVGRVFACLAAIYVTSKFTEPMPLAYATMTTVTSAISIILGVRIAEWVAGEEQ